MSNGKPRARGKSSRSGAQQTPRTLRRALIEADLVGTAQRDRAFLQSEAKMQVVSEAKDHMAALPGQLFLGQFPDEMPVSKRIQSLDTRQQSALIGNRY